MGFIGKIKSWFMSLFGNQGEGADPFDKLYDELKRESQKVVDKYTEPSNQRRR